MESLASQLDSIQERIMKAHQAWKAQKEQSEDVTPSCSSEYECPICKDTGYVVEGWNAKPCQCLEKKKRANRFKFAMVPDEFEEATMENYKVANEQQRTMKENAVKYLNAFESIKNEKQNSFGFMAGVGEQTLRSIRNPMERKELKKKHNNFGIGKTHLQIAVAKELIDRGEQVLIISDAVFMDQLAQARVADDENIEFNRLLGHAIKTPVLVWDDMGKAKPTDFREQMYYTIINERYKTNRPIIWNTNEDKDTLQERIGYAATSRLFGMSKQYLYIVEGDDYRLKG